MSDKLKEVEERLRALWNQEAKIIEERQALQVEHLGLWSRQQFEAYPALSSISIETVDEYDDEGGSYKTISVDIQTSEGDVPTDPQGFGIDDVLMDMIHSDWSGDDIVAVFNGHVLITREGISAG